MKKRYNKISGKVYEYITELYGEESAKKYLNFVQENPSFYVRVNTLKISRELLVKKLSERYGIETNHFDMIHIDHLHMAHYRHCFDGVPCIVDEHNVEYKILERCANVEKSLIKRMVFRNQAKKMEKEA